MANIWKIAPGNGAEDWPLFSKYGCIGLGWELPDYRKFIRKDEVLAALEQKYGKNTKGFGKGAADIIWRFVNEVKPGHIVVANEGYNKVVGIGVVKGEYLTPKSIENPIRDDKSSHRHHVRLVNWLIRKSVDLPGKQFFVQSTLWPLDAVKFEHVIEAYRKSFPTDTEVQEAVSQLSGGFPTPNTKEASDLNEPPTDRVLTTTYRILRDTELARRVKIMHNYECQQCGHTIVLADGSRYAESHHIKPLGNPHDGPDIMSNILCLCPNHHAECDLGVKELAHPSLRHVNGHMVEQRFIEYHNTKIHGTR